MLCLVRCPIQRWWGGDVDESAGKSLVRGRSARFDIQVEAGYARRCRRGVPGG